MKDAGIIFRQQTKNKKNSDDDTRNAPYPLNHGLQQWVVYSRLVLTMRPKLVSRLSVLENPAVTAPFIPPFIDTGTDIATATGRQR